MVPEGWQTEKLGDIAEKVMVGIASAATHAYTDRGVTLLRNLNIKEGWIDESDLLYIDREYEHSHRNKRLKEGDVITVRTGYPGISAVVPARYEGAQCFTSLITRLDQSRMLPEYFCLYINSDFGKRFISSGEAGGAQKNVNAGMLQRIKIPTPPVTEQREIVLISDVWSQAVSTLKELLDNSRTQKKALMQQLLTGKRRLSGFEDEWKESHISELASESRNASTDPHPARRLTVKLNLNGIEQREVRGTEEEVATAYYTRKAGQFIYGKQNIHKGAFGLIPYKFDGYDSSQDLPAFDLNEDCEPYWFHYYCSQEAFYKRLEARMTGTGSKRLSPEEFLRTKIPLPSLQEQKSIAAAIDTAEEEVRNLKRQLYSLTQQKAALMQQLLTGKRRVKVDKEVA